VIEKLRGLRLTKAAELVEAAVEETPNTFCARSGGVPCVVGSFPDGQSALNLAAARLRYIAGIAW